MLPSAILEMSTSDKSPTDAAAITASARAVVKYKLVDPSDKSSESAAAIFVSNDASARAFVKYKLLEPSDKSSVSDAAKAASKRADV